MAGSRSLFRRARTFARSLLLLALAVAAFASAPGIAQAATLQWEPSSSLFWVINGSVIVDLFQNGECTQWAEQKRPDIVEQIIVGSVGYELEHGLVESMPDLDARYWTSDASAVGIPTGHTPRAGALIVFQPGTLGAGSAGHIAYVTRLRRNGSFVISEMHAPLLYRVTYLTLSKSAVRLAGVSFIY